MGGTSCRVKILCPNLTLIQEKSVLSVAPDATCDAIVDYVRSHIGLSDIGKIAISSFGPIQSNPDQPHWGSITETSPKVAWRSFNLVSFLSQGFQNNNIEFELDVNASALGEYNYLKSSNRKTKTKNLAYITVGTGIGVGLIINGHIHRPHYFHQEGGHVFPNNLVSMIENKDYREKDLKHLTFEDVLAYSNKHNASSYSLENYANNVFIEKHLGVAKEQIKDLVDPQDNVWNIVALNIATLCHNILMLFGMDRIVIGGGICTEAVYEKVIKLVVALNGNYIGYLKSEDNVRNVVVRSQLGDYNTILAFFPKFDTREIESKFKYENNEEKEKGLINEKY